MKKEKSAAPGVSRPPNKTAAQAQAPITLSLKEAVDLLFPDLPVPPDRRLTLESERKNSLRGVILYAVKTGKLATVSPGVERFDLFELARWARTRKKWAGLDFPALPVVITGRQPAQVTLAGRPGVIAPLDIQALIERVRSLEEEVRELKAEVARLKEPARKFNELCDKRRAAAKLPRRRR